MWILSPLDGGVLWACPEESQRVLEWGERERTQNDKHLPNGREISQVLISSAAV